MADFFGGNLTPDKTSNKDDSQSTDPYFNQGKKRDVEYIKIPNKLRSKVGSGGLDQKILERAQSVIDNNSHDFVPDAQRHMTAIREGIRLIQTQRHKFDTDALIATIAEPAMQLKANGATFKYPMVTDISALLIRFLETLSDLDEDALDVINGFSAALNAVVVGQIQKTNSESEQLYNALEQVCQRYFEKKKK